MSAVVSFITAAAGVLLAFYTTSEWKVLVLVAGLVAVIVGVVAVLGARRQRLTGAWMAYIGIAVGVVVLVVYAVGLFNG